MPDTVLFERYRLIEPAGRGGSAEVWRALDEQTGEEVAVKRLHPVVFADAAGRQRLRREFDALRSLDEPHIVRVRDLQFGEREAALVLDFVPGESLAQRLARQVADGTPMAPETAVAIVDDVAAALTAAHAAGIVHRDVTPANILLTTDGEARLTDFGIAHASGDDPAAAVTAAGLLMGTMRYLAPEQLRGAVSTPASDLHGLAAIAYEMLAGHPAYAATSPVALAEAQEAGPPAIDGVPAGVDAAVRRGLAVDPADRPADVATFATSFAAAVADQVTVATSIEARDQTRVIPIVAAFPAASVAGAALAASAPPAAPVVSTTLTVADVGVASPARAAATHGPLPQAVGLRDRARGTGAGPARRRLGGLPAPVAVVLGLLLAVGLLAAATLPGGFTLAGAAATPSRIIANDGPASAGPSPSVAPPSTVPKGKGNGDGKGHGKGNGD